MSRAIKRALSMAAVAVVLMLTVAAPAGAQGAPVPPGTEVHAQFWGPGDQCPAGSDVTVVVDGETLDPAAYQVVTQFFVFGVPPTSLFLADIYLLDLPPGSSVMSAVCQSPDAPVAGAAIQRFATNCAGLGDPFEVNAPGYTPDLFCFKVLFVADNLDIDTFTGWSWNDGAAALDRDSAALGVGGTQILASAGLEQNTVVSIGGGETPWFVVQAVAASLGLLAMAIFANQRRRVRA